MQKPTQMIAQLDILWKEDPMFQVSNNAEFSLETDAVLYGNSQTENH